MAPMDCRRRNCWRSMRWSRLHSDERCVMADKQLEATREASGFQKQWFANLRKRVFEERRPYALVQADVPFELFEVLDIPAVSNQWWSSLIAAKQLAPPLIDSMTADGFSNQLCRYCSLGLAGTRYQ